MKRSWAGAGLCAALCFFSALAYADDSVHWSQGALNARLIQGGYDRDPKTGAWKAMVELRFMNSSLTRRYHQSVQLQFLNAQGKVLGAWKTFLSLPAGEAQHRQVQAPAGLSCPGPLEACPALSVRLVLAAAKPLDPAAPIPQRPLQEEGAPVLGSPVYAVRMVDAVTFQLLSGQRIRLLGLEAPPSANVVAKAAEGPLVSNPATDLLRQRVMEGPVTLVFDGEHRDSQGRWLALVSAEDGSLINAEMLQKGLVKADAGASFAHKADFAQAEAAARAAKRGLWSDQKP